MRVTFGGVVAFGAAGVAGWLAGLTAGMYPDVPDHLVAFETLSVPLPHHVPQFAGGVSLRFAMVHDVLLERFTKHGEAYYQERNRRTRERLDALPADDPARFPLEDDLAVGLERLGKSGDGVAVLRSKLERQRAAGLEGRDLYTTYANLGTLLIHENFSEARSGDERARDRFREGIDFIRKSVAVNPEAHFGRERWQLAIAEFLLAAMDDPTLLTRFDCLGNGLFVESDSILSALADERYFETHNAIGRPCNFGLEVSRAEQEFPEFFDSARSLDDPTRWPTLVPIRQFITKVGAEDGWEDVPTPSHRGPVPFDEPTLGIIGMWRQGGGANPHFALALGETMLRVGQRFIAWEAFERASRLADRFWPEPKIQQALRDHCEARQRAIEKDLLRRDRQEAYQALGINFDPPTHISRKEVNGFLEKFDLELTRAEEYRRAFREAEADQIAAGAPIDDPEISADFRHHHGPIASKVGREERFSGLPSDAWYRAQVRRARAWGVFGAGAGVLALAIGVRAFRSRREAIHASLS